VHEELLNLGTILALADGAFAGVALCLREKRIGICGAARAVPRSWTGFLARMRRFFF
jgi:hypothetical protein